MKKRSYRITYNGAKLETKSLKVHTNNTRLVAALRYSQKYGFGRAIEKFEYKTVDSLKRAGRKKLGDNYPFGITISQVTTEIVTQALAMQKDDDMPVQAIANHFGVSQSHLNKKMVDAKQNTNCDRIFQQLLCGKL